MENNRRNSVEIVPNSIGKGLTYRRGGRPTKYDQDGLLDAIETYIEWKQGKSTMSGMELYLFGYTGGTGGSISLYERDPRFSPIIKYARQQVRVAQEEKLIEGKGGAGLIFWFKNTQGWTDKTEVHTTQELTISNKLSELIKSKRPTEIIDVPRETISDKDDQ